MTRASARCVRRAFQLSIRGREMINIDRQKCVLVGVAIVAALALYAANITFGDLNQDEGWYLYAARQIHQGMLPYKDFFFTQAPLTPVIFALTHEVWAPYGILGARCLNAVVGLLAAFFSAWLAWRMAPERVRFYAALTGFALVACNVYQSYFTSVIKTYSLTALFIVAGALVLSWVGGRGGVWAAGFAGVLFALATGTRVSTVMVLPVVGLYLLWRKQELKPWCWLAFGVGATLGIVCVFAPWLVMCGEQFRFALNFHTARAGEPFTGAMLLKAGFLSRTVNAYFVTFALMLGVAAAYGAKRGGKNRCLEVASGVPAMLPGLLLMMVLAVTVMHMSAPFPYDDYQVPIYPLLAVAVAVLGWAMVDGLVANGASVALSSIQWAILAIVLGQAGASPINQGWFVYGRDRLWWLKKAKPDIVVLREVARQLNSLYPKKGVLLTQDTYLAVEAGWSVPAGFEMGPFSYFPGLTTAEARRYRVLNREVLSTILATCEAPLAAFSGYGMGIVSPSMVPLDKEERRDFFALVGQRYEQVGRVQSFGQAHTELTLWRLRSERNQP
jgi:hypothetical protein